MNEFKEGDFLYVPDKNLSQFLVAYQKRIVGRKGIIESIFKQLGSDRKLYRVRWLKKANRGKEFVEILYTLRGYEIYKDKP